MGLRAEDFRTEDIMIASATDNLIEVNVEIAEMMGSEIYLYTECEGSKITVKAPARVQARGGDKVKLAIDLNKMHIFDKETQKVICN